MSIPSSAEHKFHRLLLFACMITAGYFAFYITGYIGTQFRGWSYPMGTFLFAPHDRYMDFFHINHMVAGRAPYVHGSSYPPFALALASIFAKIIPGTGILSAQDVRAQEVIGVHIIKGMYAGSALIASGLYGLSWIRREKENAALLSEPGENIDPANGNATVHRRSYIKKALLPTILFGIALFFAAPAIFSFDRGNYLVLCVLALFFFAYFFDSHPIVSALFLAAAASLKLYPLAFFLLFVQRRQWKALFVGLTGGFLVTLGSFALFEGSIRRNILLFLNNLLNFTGGLPDHHYFYYQHAVGVRTLISAPFFVFGDGVPADFPIARWTSIATLIVLVLVIVLCFLEKEMKRRVLYLTILMILFPTPSFYYNLFFLLIPAYFFLTDKTFTRADWCLLIAMAVLLVPKSYWFKTPVFLDIRVHISIGPLMDAYIMAGILVGRLFVLTYERSIGRKRGKAKISETCQVVTEDSL